MRTPVAGERVFGRAINNNIDAIRTLAEDEHREISDALSIIRVFHRESQSYEHVRRDYDDLVQYTSGIRQLMDEHGTSPDLALDVEVELNRRVMALLSSFRAFLDHTEHALSRRFGRESDELRSFRRGCAAEYDSEFSYRFATRLRNYAQHRDLPIGYPKLTGASKITGHSAEISLECVRDQLLTSGFDWKSLRAELEAQPQSWNIHTTIDKLMPCLARLRAIAMRPQLAEVRPAAERLVGLAREAGGDSQPAIVTIIDPTPGAEVIRVALIPHHHAAEILELPNAPSDPE